MVQEMKKVFRAIDQDDQYDMHTQYEKTLKSLVNSGEIHVKHIWKKFTLLIDWMEKNFTKEKFFDVLGKKYDFSHDGILCRIQKPEDKKFSSNDEEVQESNKYETWLMSNLFRYVENPSKQNDPIHKYVGKIKFTKLVNGEYEGDFDIWTPSMKKDNGEDVEVDDIRIEVYNDDGTLRRYELEHGWRDKWSTDQYLLKNDKEFLEFEKQWRELESKMKIPPWYRFDPRYPNSKKPENHNLVRAWDNSMFDSLKHQKWFDTMADKNQPVEKSDFVIDCSNLLGIGGEGIVIRKSVTTKISSSVGLHQEDTFQAFKIIPIMDATENLKTVYHKYAADTPRHDSIIDYLDIYLDVIRIFGQKYFAMVIGKYYRQHRPENLNKFTSYLKNFPLVG